LDVYHTSTHGVALVRILNAGPKCAACGSLEMQDPKIRKKWPSGHHRTTLLGYIFVHKAYIDNRKKPVKLAATLRWFTAGGAIRIALRQLSQSWKLRHYDVITRKL